MKEVFKFQGDLRQLAKLSTEAIIAVVPSYEKVLFPADDVPAIPISATYEATDTTYTAHTIVSGFDINITMPWDKVTSLIQQLGSTIAANEDLDPDYAGNMAVMIEEFCKVDPRAFVKAMHNIPTHTARGV